MTSYLRAYEDGTECSEMSAYKIQTSGNYPAESVQHSEQGESLKSRNFTYVTPDYSLADIPNTVKFCQSARHGRC